MKRRARIGFSLYVHLPPYIPTGTWQFEEAFSLWKQVSYPCHFSAANRLYDSDSLIQQIYECFFDGDFFALYRENYSTCKDSYQFHKMIVHQGMVTDGTGMILLAN